MPAVYVWPERFIERWWGWLYVPLPPVLPCVWEAAPVNVLLLLLAAVEL